jgi:hypothetical protein
MQDPNAHTLRMLCHARRLYRPRVQKLVWPLSSAENTRKEMYKKAVGPYLFVG